MNEPRLLSLKELGKDRWSRVCKRPVWVEYYAAVRVGGWAFVADQTKTYLNFQFEPLIGPGHLKKSEYNKEWRMWTDEPTEEQRKAVPWL